jgi:hypothetical protein
MPPKKKKQTFKELQATWYAKLKKTGFKDIEKDEYNLKNSTSELSRYYDTPDLWKAKETYYQMTDTFLNEYKFDTRIHKLIWEYHSNGISIRDIAKILTKAKIKSVNTSKSEIGVIVKKLKNSMYEMYLAPKKEYHE